MGTEIQGGCIVFYQPEKGKPANIPAGGSVSANLETIKG